MVANCGGGNVLGVAVHPFVLVTILTLVSAMSPAVYGGVSEWEAHAQEGLTYYKRGDYGNAAVSLEAALKEAEALGETDPRLAVALNNLSVQYLSLGDHGKAEPLLMRLLENRQRALGPEHPDVVESLNNLASLYGSQGKYAEAEPLLERAAEISEKTLGREHPHVAASLNNLAMIYSAQGKYIPAVSLLKRSAEIWEKARDTKFLAIALENMAMLYAKMGMPSEAEEAAHRAARALALEGNEREQSRYVLRRLR